MIENKKAETEEGEWKRTIKILEGWVEDLSGTLESENDIPDKERKEIEENLEFIKGLYEKTKKEHSD